MNREQRNQILQRIRKLEKEFPVLEPDVACNCGGPDPIYRCEQCFTPVFMCKQCTLDWHRLTPLHRIETFKDGRLHSGNLKALGLRVQLGHPLPEACPLRISDDNFVIIDAQGAHEVMLDYCGEAAFRQWRILQHLKMLKLRDAMLDRIHANNVVSFGPACVEPGKDMPDIEA
ncbi:hypothetical protein B0H17DRAFT_1206918 [Mycena rosella]|uniref:CxC2-like cysteine cluster KDZ transposase-associated domain-containing protein n=1 Tax=Mycena rosella TaxID=1033263 RepID=A0AAD7G8I0_MYCRO|nr:hypothetical protein B0H17DRAFT_1206918 [Mycena rosella]